MHKLLEEGERIAKEDEEYDAYGSEEWKPVSDMHVGMVFKPTRLHPVRREITPYTPALTALRDLYHACRRADEAGELHSEVKGEYMDAALRVLQKYSKET